MEIKCCCKHDELVFDVHNDELEKIQPMIKHEMENALNLRFL
jgi:DNA polymerase-1